MHINNLGGARMPVTTTANGASQTARTNFGSLVSASAGATAGRPAAITGSSIIASAVSVNAGGIPGFGAPYQQALPSTGGAQSPAPTAPTAPGATVPGSEFNAELQGQAQQQQQLKELAQLSFASFVSSTFAMGQNRPRPDDW